MQIGISIVLSFSVFKLRLSDDVPVQSDTIPLINVYFTLCMSFALSAMIWFSLRNILVENKHVPNWIRYLIFNYIWYILFVGYWKRYRDKVNQIKNQSNRIMDENFYLLNDEKSLKKDNLIFDFTTPPSKHIKSIPNNYSSLNKSKSISPSRNKAEGVFNKNDNSLMNDKKKFNVYVYDTNGKQKLLISVNNRNQSNSIIVNKDNPIKAATNKNNNNKSPIVKTHDLYYDSITTEYDEFAAKRSKTKNKKTGNVIFVIKLDNK
jgi:hypothetical protein